MVRNVKVLEGKQYSTRKIRKVIIDEQETQRDEKTGVLKEKNRQSAQKSRDNKKNYIRSLERRIQELEDQNQRYKSQLEQCKCPKAVYSHQVPEEAGRQKGSTVQMESQPSTEENQTDSHSDDFERMSVKSFVSCGNFLMLAIVAMCCVFGCLEHAAQTPNHKTLYGIQSLEHIMKNSRIPQVGKSTNSPVRIQKGNYVNPGQHSSTQQKDPVARTPPTSRTVNGQTH